MSVTEEYWMADNAAPAAPVEPVAWMGCDGEDFSYKESSYFTKPLYLAPPTAVTDARIAELEKENAELESEIRTLTRQNGEWREDRDQLAAHNVALQQALEGLAYYVQPYKKAPPELVGFEVKQGDKSFAEAEAALNIPNLDSEVLNRRDAELLRLSADRLEVMEREHANFFDRWHGERRSREKLVDDVDRCYRMLLSDPNTKSALFKAENILREALADAKSATHNAKITGAGTASAWIDGLCRWRKRRTEMTDYKSMFEQAVRTLAAIDEALGIGDDGCGDPDQTLTAIAELKDLQKMEAQQLRKIHPLDFPLEVFLADLTTRPANIIRAELAGYASYAGTGTFDIEPPFTVRHLCMFSRSEMRKWPNFGCKCLNEVEEMLRARGLQLWENHDERSLRLLREHKEYFK